MSTQAMADFLVEANQNEALATGMVEAIGDKEGSDATSAVAAYASQNGYDVTVEDAAQAQAVLVKATEGESELSDDDLDDVSGGVVGPMALAAAAITTSTVGTGGAVAAVTIGRGIDNTVKDIGNFFKQW